MNKRVAIGIAAALAGLIVVTVLGVLVAEDDRQLGALNRSTVAPRFSVDIDGFATAVRSVKGCGITGAVVKAAPGADNVKRKHVANVEHQPCVIEVNASMGKGAYEWIKQTLARQLTTKTVTITEADFNYNAKTHTTLSNAVLTKVRFPALNGSSKDAAHIELTFQPEQIQKQAAGGEDIRGVIGPKQKAWLASNFEMTLGTLPTQRVASISAIEVTQTISQDEVGTVRTPTATATTFDVSDVVVTVSTVDRQPWDTWFDDFVVKGLNTQSHELTGKIEFKTPDLQSVLFTLSLAGVGIYKAEGPPLDASAGTVARSTYSLYVEEVAFSSTEYDGAGTPTGGTEPAPGPAPQAAPTVPLEATITPVAAELLVDGETFTISDGVNEPTVFEFDLDGITKAGVAVKITKEAPALEVAASIVEAINSVPESLEIVAKATEDEVVQLRSETGAEAGEEKVLEFVESEEFRARDAIPAEKGLPAPATLKAATGGAEGEIELAWEPSEGALGYLVLATTEQGGEYNELDKTEGTELTVAGLESGVTHYFVVRALDGTRQSANSPEASAPAG
jgi:hypothetical protein